MWTLKKPDITDALAHIQMAFTYVNGRSKYEISPEELKIVEAIYQDYEARKGIAHINLKGEELRKNLLIAFEESYNEIQQKGRLKELRSQLLLNARKCPCCEISAVNVLDHYLPQALYKVLSIYSSNIVPYCQTCNLKKLAAPGIDNNERFIHAYYDEIPDDVQFLTADVWIKEMGLQCKLRILNIVELDEQLRLRMENQIAKVGLEERILKELFDILIPMGIDDTYEAGGQEAVRELLIQNTKRMKNAYGLNSWKHAIIQALSNNPDFCGGGFKICLSIEN